MINLIINRWLKKEVSTINEFQCVKKQNKLAAYMYFVFISKCVVLKLRYAYEICRFS